MYLPNWIADSIVIIISFVGKGLHGTKSWEIKYMYIAVWEHPKMQ